MLANSIEDHLDDLFVINYFEFLSPVTEKSVLPRKSRPLGGHVFVVVFANKFVLASFVQDHPGNILMKFLSNGPSTLVVSC